MSDTPIAQPTALTNGVASPAAPGASPTPMPQVTLKPSPAVVGARPKHIVRPSPFSRPSAPAAIPAAAPTHAATAAPAPTTPETAPTPDGTPLTPAGDDAVSGAAASDTTAPAAGEASDSSPAAEEKPPEPEIITAAEEAKRLARIKREGERLEARRREFSGQMAIAKTVAEIFGPQATPESVRQYVVQSHKVLTDAAQLAKRDPVGFLRDNFGIQPQETADALLRHHQADPAQYARDQERAAVERQNAEARALIEETKRARDQLMALQTEQQVAAYKRDTIAPILQGPDYVLTTHEFGAQAADKVYELIAKRYQYSNGSELLTPKQAADRIEASLRAEITKAEERRKLLNGPSAKPAAAQAQTTPKPLASEAKTPTTGTAQNAFVSAAFRPTPKAFVVKPRS